MAELMLALFFIFFAANLWSACVWGIVVAKGGLNSELPMIAVIRRSERPMLFAACVGLYTLICGVLTGMMLEVLGLYDVPYFAM